VFIALSWAATASAYQNKEKQTAEDGYQVTFASHFQSLCLSLSYRYLRRVRCFGRCKLLARRYCAMSRNRIHDEMQCFSNNALVTIADTTNVVQRHN
jgi:hypothetical protein